MTSPRSRSLLLAVAATAAAAVLAGCGSDDPKSTAADPSATSSDSPGATSAPVSPETTDSGEPAETLTVPIYFVGDGPRGPVLFREFRAVEADNPMEEAAALLTAGDTLDPDYGTLFPAGSFGAIRFDGTGAAGVVQVELSDDGWTTAPQAMSKAEAKLAAQSLVYTMQGVVQARAAVQVTLGGQPTTLFGIDAAELTDAPQLDVLNLVSVTTPEEGASVSGSFTASGIGSSFEATIPWEIRQGDQVVQSGFSTAEGWMDKLYPWETEVDVSDLAPGEYSFVAMTDDPSGGEGFGPSEDSKTITIE